MDGHGHRPISGSELLLLCRADPDVLASVIDEIFYLRKRNQELLESIAKISRESISHEEAMELNGQIAALIAEVGTLRSIMNNCDGSCGDGLLILG